MTNHNVPHCKHGFDVDCVSCSQAGLTVVTGAKAVSECLTEFASGVKCEVATISPGNGWSAEDLEQSRIRNILAYKHDIRARTIYLTTVRQDQTMLSHVKWLNERGAEVRTAPKLPIRAIIVDRELAILPLDMSNGNNGIIVHRAPSTVIAIQELFEMVWRSAQPLGMARLPDGQKLSDEERAILELMALGNTNADIGRRLGISGRTIRRRVQELQHQLGADSRIKAVYLAAKKGLI